MKKHAHQQGYMLLWVAISIALIVCAFLSGSLADGDISPAQWQATVIAGSFAGTGLLVEAKRDFFYFVQYTAIVTPIAILISSAICFYGTEAHPYALTTAIISTIAFCASVTYLLWTQYSKDPFPNLLRTHVDDDAIVELHDVQLTAQQSGHHIDANSGASITFIVQNGADRERVVSFRLKPHRRLHFNRHGLLFEKTPSLTLAAGEAAMLTVPVLAEQKANGRYTLEAFPRVTEKQGVRIRRWRATPVKSYPSWYRVVTALLLRTLISSDFVFEFHAKTSSLSPNVDKDPPPANIESIWTPSREELLALQRGEHVQMDHRKASRFF